jgi:soluble lytic murein transglycosylase-like protein
MSWLLAIFGALLVYWPAMSDRNAARPVAPYRTALGIVLLVLSMLVGHREAQAATVAIPEQSARYRIALEREAAARFGLSAPVARLAAQIHQESAWKPTAASPFAQGLAQFTPSTAAWLPDVCPEVGPPDVWDAGWSIRAIACYDAWLHANVIGAATACDRWAFTLSSYNGGLGWLNRDRARASSNGLDPARWFDHVETTSARANWARVENRDYVRRILLKLEPAYLAAGWSGQAVCP